MAITIPRATPMTIDSTVRVSDVRTPSMTGGRNMLSSMKPHWNASFVRSMWTNIATTMARMTIATHRPGCRTGTAVMASGCARSGVLVSVMLGPGSRGSGVDGGVGDGPGLDAPLLEDRLVGAVADQRADRVGDRLGELGLVLLDHVPVRRRLVAVDGDGRVAGALAVLVALGQVLGLLHGRGLDGHLLAAGVVGLDPGRVALLGPPLGARAEV